MCKSLHYFLPCQKVFAFYFCGVGEDEFLEKELVPVHLPETNEDEDPEIGQEDE